MKYLLPAILVVLAGAALGGLHLLAHRIAPKARLEVKDTDNDPPPIDATIPDPYLLQGPGEPAPEITGEYLRYRGADGTARVDTGRTYDFDWRKTPPELQWERELGWGHAGFAVMDGKVYLQDYEINSARKAAENQFYVVFKTAEDLADFTAFIQDFAFDDQALEDVKTIFTEMHEHTWTDDEEQNRRYTDEQKAKAKERFAEDLKKQLKYCEQLAPTDPTTRAEKLARIFLGEVDLPAFLNRGHTRGLHYGHKYRDTVDWIVRVWEHRNGREIERVYGYEDMVRCLSLKDGRDIWRLCHYVKMKPIYGLSRSTPSLTPDRVLTLGPGGLLLCLDAHTGERKWAKDIRAEYGAKIPTWYNAQSPLVVDNPVKPGEYMVLLACAGTEAGQNPGKIMVALDLENGDLIWASPNTWEWKLSHATPVLMDVDGKEAAVYCAIGGVVAIKVKGGTALWATDKWKVKTATVTVPVECGDGRVFLCGAYGAGAKMLQWYREGDGYQVRELWSLPAKDQEDGTLGFECEQHGPIHVAKDDFLYGVNSNRDVQALCGIDARTGTVAWRLETEHKYKWCSYFMSDDTHLFITPDTGKGSTPLQVYEVSPQGAELLCEVPVTRGDRTYAMMTLAGDRLLVRDRYLMQCWKLPTRP